MKSACVIAVLFLILVGARHASAQEEFASFDKKVLHIGAIAPDLPYFRLSDGEPGSLATSHKGKIVVLEFWATWCAPCQSAMDELQKTAAKFDGQKDEIEFLAISIDGVEDKDKGPAFTGQRPDLIEKAANHAKQKGWTHTFNAWCGNDVRKTWPTRMVPMTFVIGADSRIIHTPGPENLEAVIAPLLAGPEPAAADYQTFDRRHQFDHQHPLNP